MRINFSIFRDCKHQSPKATCDTIAPISYTSFNIREEYANAFRTESYNEFWAHVLDLTLPHGSTLKPTSTSAARLPSYRLFSELLLDPDQSTATQILTHSLTHPQTLSLLSDYYSHTANASLLCGLLLKNIDQIRTRYRPLRSAIRSNNPQCISTSLSDLSNTLNPLTSSQLHFRAVQAGSASLLGQLDSSRKRARAKLRLVNRLKRGAAVCLIVLTASASLVGACFAAHVLVMAVAVPAFLTRLGSSRWLARVVAQLDTAAKGTYILNRDLDTISRLVARVHDEVEHVLGLVRFCRERGEERGRLVEEVVREIGKNDGSFNGQLDELEEHLYLCFMTINKARGLVMKEVLVASGVKLNGLM